MRLEKRQKSKRREVSRHAANKAIDPVAFIFVFFSAKTVYEKLSHYKYSDDDDDDDDDDETATRAEDAK
jgi:hypothetical protein